MRRGWKVGRLAGDRPPGSGGEAENGLRGPKRGHPGGVVVACLGLQLSRFAVGHGDGRGLGADDDGVLDLHAESGGAESLAGGSPLDLEERADYRGRGGECGLEGDRVEVEGGLARGREREEIRGGE